MAQGVARDTALFFALLFTGAMLAACGGAAEPPRDSSVGATSTQTLSSGETAPHESQVSSDSGKIRDVHAIHRSRCGNCHVRVEPGTRTRAELQSAFERHHTRVKMNDAEWASMVDYLASDGPARAQAEQLSAEK